MFDNRCCRCSCRAPAKYQHQCADSAKTKQADSVREVQGRASNPKLLLGLIFPKVSDSHPYIMAREACALVHE